MANLKTIRAQIEKLESERQRVAAAVPPAEQSEQRLREHLAALAEPSADFLSGCALAVNTGVLAGLTPATAPMLAQAAFALALDAKGVERVIEAAKQLASAQDNGALRLDDAEKTERLHALACDIYQLNLDEEAARDDAPRRADANAAAVLGIPLDAAIEFGLL